MKKIGIVSYSFYPNNSPRAFRAFELAKEFSKKGHNVTVYISKFDYNFNEIEEKYGFKVQKIESGYFLNKDSKKQRYNSFKNMNSKFKPNINKENIYKQTIKRIVKPLFNLIFIDGFRYEFSNNIYKYFKQNKSSFDLLISNGLPFSVHLGCSKAISKKYIIAQNSVAEYGDPFSFNSSDNKNEMIIRRKSKIEKKVLESFNHITIPTSKSIDSYLALSSRDKIKIIPQGYNLKEIKIAQYKRNEIPTFAFAGIFYKKIRDPESFFEHLIKIDKDFKFILYTDINNKENMDCILPYIENLEKKIKINNIIPRNQCLYKLSKMDFLINQENLNSGQVPSKIIDYSITGRPIYSFSQDSFKKEIMDDFLNGSYDQQIRINLDDYSIESVTEKFLNL